jgi:uncharacterized short protein YbdD (DUF466 family)
MPKPIVYQPIGIAGNASVGKDTLCKYLIQEFKKTHDITAKRCSIAGDTIRKDLKSLVLKKSGINIENATPKEKELVRPIMVEYGRFMRNQTEGRYFIEEIEKKKNFGANFIPIIPDIRYSEYQFDEAYWLLKERDGLLVFLERKGIKPANKFEELNNKKLKKVANMVINVPTLDYYLPSMQKTIDKIITTYLSDIFQL